MRLILVTGGARSGKSAYAQERAERLGGGAVTMIATARPDDPEMARRIARHRRERPRSWPTEESPLDVASALRQAATDVVLLDFLTLYLSNRLAAEADPDERSARAAMARAVDELLGAAGARSGTLIVVTNEVGWGIVPENPLGRWFRDGLGSANRRLAAAAAQVVLVVAGIPLVIEPDAPIT